MFKFLLIPLQQTLSVPNTTTFLSPVMGRNFADVKKKKVKVNYCSKILQRSTILFLLDHIIFIEMKSSCTFWEVAIIKGNGRGWMDFIPVRLAFPRILLCYIMTKSLIIPLRLNHVCFFTPRASSALVYQQLHTSPAESALRGSSHSAKSSILRGVCACVCARVCLPVCG